METATTNNQPEEGFFLKHKSIQAIDLFNKSADFAKFVQEKRACGNDVYSLPVLEYRGGRALVDGGKIHGTREVVVMCSADYLGLAHHPDIIASGIRALENYGTNVGSVPLFGGTTAIHKNFQYFLAEFLGVENCVFFPTGYAANMGTIQALCNCNDTVVFDKLCHYSILDGITLSKAHKKTFQHSDPDHLKKVLAAIRETRPNGGILVIAEGVYGVDGDVAPLNDLLAVAELYGARLMLDEAHALGVIGNEGRGTASHQQTRRPPDIIAGSLSKALAAPGGFIACPEDLTDYIRFFARTAVFSAGVQTVSIALATAALDFIHTNPDLIDKLQTNSDYLRTGLVNLGLSQAARSQSAIMSVIVGNEERLLDISRELFNSGVWAETLPYPAVPLGEARIRFRVSAAHTKEDLDFVLERVKEIFTRYGVV